MSPSAEPIRRRRGALVAVRVVVPVVFAFSLWYLFTHVVRFGYVVSRSMEPTLQVADYYLLRLHAYDLEHPPQRGDLIVFTAPDGTPWVKRVIGLGGERLLVAGGNVWLNGKWLPEPYLKERPRVAPPMPAEVPEGSVYVMGDNRNLSEDSRDDGPVPVDQIMGRVIRIVWPPDRARVFETVRYPD